MVKLISKIKLDKLLHFVCGTYLFLFASIFLSMWLSIAIVAVIGAAKEVIYDKWMKKGTPEWMDLIYTIVGGSLALLLTL